jgi:very-short-patch-repair endonuclease
MDTLMRVTRKNERTDFAMTNSRAKNIRVLRFGVDRVMHYMENVLQEIREACS